MSFDYERPEPRRGVSRLAPSGGWFALGLVTAICLALAWSLDDAVLVLGDGQVTDFLAWTAVAGVLVGVVGPTVGWGRWTTHLIGATFAALVTPLLVGSVLLRDVAGAHDLHALFQKTTDASVTAYTDLLVVRSLSTFQYGHHLLVLGLIVWGSAQFASYATFGHRRPLNAVFVIGLLLLANMWLTFRDQLPQLVLFSVASLFLLVRFHTFDEQSDWLRRRIGDPSAISGLYLRGGTVFISAAVIGSLLLTNFASSAPLRAAWTDVGSSVVDWTRTIQRFLPTSQSGRSIGPSFGQTAIISGAWITNNDPFLTMEISTTETEAPYLAAYTYRTFDRTGWQRDVPTLNLRAAGEDLLGGTADELIPQGRRELKATITLVSPRRTVFTPTMPLSVDQETGVMLIGEGGYFEGLERPSSDSAYTVTALVPASEADGGPTEARLRLAGTDYPEEVMRLYGPDTVADDVLGEASRALLSEIRTRAGPRATPYDLVKMTRDILKDSTRFEYDPNVQDRLPECTDMSIVECFARIKSGYCEYYATTMAILVREMEIPTRLVEGFLPGRRDLGTGKSTVLNSDSHAWVQVYFPDWGWIDFDPTGVVSTLPPLPSGRPDASPTARASGSTAPVTRRPESADPRTDPETGLGAGGIRPPGAAGPMIAIAILLAVIVAAIAAVVWRRGPRGPVSAEGTYGSVTRLASRFGFAPRPNQTVYEYAGALADVLPTVRPELETVARAKVEVAYGGRVLGDEGLRSLREAHRRLRIGLLRLLTRRVRRRRKPRP
jgi:transglutaminase-like putative cysteine protease